MTDNNSIIDCGHIYSRDMEEEEGDGCYKCFLIKQDDEYVIKLICRECFPLFEHIVIPTPVRVLYFLHKEYGHSINEYVAYYQRLAFYSKKLFPNYFLCRYEKGYGPFIEDKIDTVYNGDHRTHELSLWNDICKPLNFEWPKSMIQFKIEDFTYNWFVLPKYYLDAIIKFCPGTDIENEFVRII